MSNTSETRQLLIDTAERIFADHCNKAALDAAERGEFPAALWQTLRDNGFHELALAGSGVPLGDTFAVLQVAARHAVPLPLTEILLANRWLDSGAQLATVGLLQGAAIIDAPWARGADVVLGIDTDTGELVQQGRTAGEVVPGSNMAGEARDRVTLAPGAARSVQSEPAFELIALGRAVAISGTLQRILALALQYANEREQFGRSISKFQAIQHNLAVMAGEVAAASRAADAAIDALDTDRFGLEVAAAKARIGEAAGVVAEIAHQVHGAMGYTHEHTLHHFTRRVWAWRDEYGNETWWQARLGRHLASLGADQLWGFLATRG
ncbi:MAG: acyl-CoA dehydrogenase family protein [Gammaproteobacteria bacterium]